MNTVLQIQAAVAALRNTRGLPWTAGHKKKLDEDILDWLQSMFGFQVMLANILFQLFDLKFLSVTECCSTSKLQKDNVSNQREHLILLLANVHIRQFPRPEQQPKVCIL